MIKRCIATLLASVAVLVALVALAPAASAAPLADPGLPNNPITVGAVTHNCGVATCSVYLSRSASKAIGGPLDNKVVEYGRIPADMLTCGKLAAIPIPYVGIGLALYCSFRAEQVYQAFDEAVEKNKCVKITYLRTGQVTHISTNNGAHCKN
jgi:hypothetical protein